MFGMMGLALACFYVVIHGILMWQQIRTAQANLDSIQKNVQDTQVNNQHIQERIRLLNSPEGQEQWAREKNFSRVGEVVYFLQPSQKDTQLSQTSNQLSQTGNPLSQASTLRATP
jgi:cell division protein FtsB